MWYRMWLSGRKRREKPEDDDDVDVCWEKNFWHILSHNQSEWFLKGEGEYQVSHQYRSPEHVELRPVRNGYLMLHFSWRKPHTKHRSKTPESLRSVKQDEKVFNWLAIVKEDRRGQAWARCCLEIRAVALVSNWREQLADETLSTPQTICPDVKFLNRENNFDSSW